MELDEMLNIVVPEDRMSMMTLRDYFAGQALCGLAAHIVGAKQLSGESPPEAHARLSYVYADAMIKERSK